MKMQSVVSGSILRISVCCVMFLALCGPTYGDDSSKKPPYPQKVPCPGPVMERRILNGAPALFIDGKPTYGLMASAPYCTSPAVVGNGQVTLTGRGAIGFPIETTRAFENQYAVEATVTVKKLLSKGASFSIRIKYDNTDGYLLLLKSYKTGNVALLWKRLSGTAGWRTVPFAWTTGKPYRMRVVVDGNKVKGFVNGKFIGESVNEKPLPVSTIMLSAYHCTASVDEVRVTHLNGALLFSDDFAKPRPERWSHARLTPPRITFPEAGVHFYTFGLGLSKYGGVSDCWRGPGKYDFSSVDRMLSQVIKEDPEALILPRVNINPPAWWLKAHPEEASLFYRRSGSSGRGRYASFTSKRWIEDATRALRQYIRHINSSPYGKHIVGYNIMAGAGGEWVYSWSPRYHDYSLNQLRGFRKWLRGRYSNIAALREAWKDPGVTFDSAQIPSYKERMKGDYYEFRDRAKGTRVTDYLSFHSIAVTDALLHFAGAVKEETERKKLTWFFYGYHFFGNDPYVFLNEGHNNLARLLRSPDVDVVCAPHISRGKHVGGATVAPVPIGSVRLNRKLYYNEDDSRTFLSGRHDYGHTETLAQTVNVLKRNFAYCLSHGISLWWMDWGRHWYNHDTVMQTIARVQEIATESLTRDRRPNAEIAVIVSEESVNYLRPSTSLLMSLIPEQYCHHLPYVGAPFHTYLLSDLARIPEYKFYIFLDTFRLSNEDKKTIRKKILCNNHTVLWVYAPGYVTEKALVPEAVTEITGIKLAAKHLGGRLHLTLCDMDHEITKGLDPGLEWVSWGAFGPVFYCVDSEAGVLGMLKAVPATDQQGKAKTAVLFKPGLAVKEMDGWRSVWCGVPAIPAGVLRGIAGAAGVHIYTPGNDVVYANRFMVAVHTRYAGKRVISLPHPASVTDAFTGEKIAEKAKTFEVHLDQFETGIWLLD